MEYNSKGEPSYGHRKYYKPSKPIYLKENEISKCEAIIYIVICIVIYYYIFK